MVGNTCAETEGTYQIANESLPPPPATGWAARIHPEDVEKASRFYQRAVETGEAYEEPVEMRLLGQDDAIIDITYELQAERNPAGECTGFVGVFSDVSSLRRLEHDRMAAEQARREEAEQNRQLQEHFIDITCHELRNPLSSILNSAEMLGESLQRMSKLVDENPQLKEVMAPLANDMQDDMEAVETILISSRHQKRIADGECLMVAYCRKIWSDGPYASGAQTCCIYPRSAAISYSSSMQIGNLK